FAKRFGEGIGAYIMGRNMFGPVRGPWPDDRWRGWWGENPPYHVPVFVLTHHAREPITMKGGTVFHFVTGGIEEALRRAREAAGRRHGPKTCWPPCAGLGPTTGGAAGGAKTRRITCRCSC